MKLGLLVADKPCSSFAAVFTRNAFPGHPVVLARQRMQQATMQGVVVNNKISNVGAPGGLQHAIELSAEASHLLDIPQDALFAASTGIIGWSLPVNDMKAAMPALVEGLGSLTAVDFAQAIMTTDRYPKLRCQTLGAGSILGVAKGAGMIEPNMGTMLVFIVTDIHIDRDLLQPLLSRVVEQTFNSISIDSDQSTSDMCMLFSSSMHHGVAVADFEAALIEVCKDLAADIVRNGEGTSHVLRCSVKGFGDLCRSAGKAIINSPLVKTAMYGNDPNVGRIVAALGDFWGNAGKSLDASALFIRLQGIEVMTRGVFHLDAKGEQQLSAALKQAAQDPAIGSFPEHEHFVDLEIELQGGAGQATVYGSDLGYEYVRENADYRS